MEWGIPRDLRIRGLASVQVDLGGLTGRVEVERVQVQPGVGGVDRRSVDQGALDAAWDLVKDWSIEELQALRAEVPRLALKTPFRNRTVKEVALNALQISHKGLHNRQRVDNLRMDETHFLKPLFQTAHSGLTPADELLAAYEGRWEGEITPIFQEYTY
mgnify:CR=1 FL=1